MDATSRRLRQALYGDENATLPSKQASMAATNALQQARAMEAPSLPRRAPLQPLAQNVVNANRAASTKPGLAVPTARADSTDKSNNTEEVEDATDNDDDDEADDEADMGGNSDATIDDNEEHDSDDSEAAARTRPAAKRSATSSSMDTDHHEGEGHGHGHSHSHSHGHGHSQSQTNGGAAATAAAPQRAAATTSSSVAAAAFAAATSTHAEHHAGGAATGHQFGAHPYSTRNANSTTNDADSGAADDDEELVDTIDDDEEFDDAQLLSRNHSHTASFGDDETDENDEIRLRLAIMNQPPASCNPDALFPVESVTARLTLDKCSQIVASTPGVLDAEDEDMWDASMVLEYSEEIFRHLRVMELRLLPDKGYMAQQKELNWTFRTVLIDWLVKIHFRFNLLPETLYLCVNYVDRFLSVKEVSLSRLQLVGAVALFIAAKFEEINYLSVQEVSQMVENVYSVEEILKAERYMIDLLDFNLGFPGPMSFLRRVSKADDYELETRTLAKYLLEVTMMDARFVAAPPSWCAAIAHYMSRHMLRQGPWSARHVYFSTYTEEQLLPGVGAVREALEDPQMHHQAVFEKYSERKFRKAALFVRNWLQLARERPELDFAAN